MSQIQGSIVALVTPFKNGEVDVEALEALVAWHIEQGTNAIVPCGTTGESPTLSHDEHRTVIECVIKAANGKVPVYAGTGSNATSEALSLTSFAKSAGADAVLSVVPYYNKPTQEGLYAHYATIAEAVDIPTILYNVPGRTGGRGLAPATVARLSKLDPIVAIKEASGSMDQTSEILSLCDITVVSGDDSLTLPLMAIGAKGVISVVANLIPSAWREMVDAMLAGEVAKACAMHTKYFPLCRAMFVETNPIPVKAAMRMLGRGSDEMRLPLVPLQADSEKVLADALSAVGLTS